MKREVYDLKGDRQQGIIWKKKGKTLVASAKTAGRFRAAAVNWQAFGQRANQSASSTCPVTKAHQPAVTAE